jgi:hypothetical protein
MDIEHTRPATTTATSPSLLGSLARLLRALLKIALGLVGFVLLLSALFVGLMLALGIVIWARLRGRRAAPGVFTAAYQKARRRPSARAAPTGQVVDVEAREVPDRTHAPNTPYMNKAPDAPNAPNVHTPDRQP